MTDLKPCPFRTYGERRNSLTINGEYTYVEQFMPCMGAKCACYYDAGDEVRCNRDNVYLVLLNRRAGGQG